MKIRTDFVTNSSSSSFYLAMYREKPEEEYFHDVENKSFRDCSLEELADLYIELCENIMTDLCGQMFREGLTDELRHRIYTWIFWSRIYCAIKPDKVEEMYASIQDFVKKQSKVEKYLINHGLTEPEEEPEDQMYIEPDGELERRLVRYIYAYESSDMLEYLQSFKAETDTFYEWFEQMSQCTWMICCAYGEDDCPVRNPAYIYFGH